MNSSDRDIVVALKQGDRVALARAITLCESKLPAHRARALEMLAACYPVAEERFRIAITGSPGVGKSTLIENMGLSLISQGHKVAVLAIDPSSSLSGGSILGDKTRMNELSRMDEAFVRPSPAGQTLGGIAARTREAISLCEAAGYDIILIETVGVGQSEVKASQMVDLFLLMILPGSGDELQGIKRGIVELADLIAINKCDADASLAKTSLSAYRQAAHIHRATVPNWSVPVLQTSGLQGLGLPELIEEIFKFRNHIQKNGWLKSKRAQQQVLWFEESAHLALLEWIAKDDELSKTYQALLKSVHEEHKFPPIAASEWLSTLKKK